MSSRIRVGRQWELPDPEGLHGRAYIYEARAMWADPQVASVLAAILLPLRSARWHIAVGDSDPAHAEAIAHDLGLPVGQAEGRTGPQWRQVIEQITTALIYGVSLHEIVVRPDSDRVALEALHWREPWGIQSWQRDRVGRVVSVRHAGVDLSMQRIMRLSWQESIGGPWGVGLLRSAVDPWRRKRDALEVQSLGARRTGLGVPVYTGPQAPEGLSQEDAEAWAEQDLADGLDIATSLRAGQMAGVALPHGATLQLLGVQGDLPDLGGIVQQHDQSIARATLAHLLTLGTQTGSWALGTAFVGLLGTALQEYASAVAASVQSLVDRLVGWSWPGSPAPVVQWAALDRSAASVVEAVERLVRVGAIAPDGRLDATLRDMLGLPRGDRAALGEEESPED